MRPVINSSGTEKWIKVGGEIVKGHRIASGFNSDSPYSAGALELQLPHFRELGLDLSSFFMGTVNVSIWPYTFILTNPRYTFRQVNWTPFHPPEDFSFSGCKLLVGGVAYGGWVYYPHPETKEDHFQDPSIVEIIGPLIPGISYGDRVDVLLNSQEITVVKANS